MRVGKSPGDLALIARSDIDAPVSGLVAQGKRALEAALLEAQSALGHGVALLAADRVVFVNDALVEMCATAREELGDRSALLERIDVGQRARLARLLSSGAEELPQRFDAVLVRTDRRRLGVEIELGSCQLNGERHAYLCVRSRSGSPRPRRALDGWERQAFVNEAGELLASIHEEDRFLHAVAQLAVPRFADWCLIEVLEEEERGLRLMASVHVERDAGWLAAELRRTRPRDDGSPYTLRHVLETGRAVLISDIDDAITDPRTNDPEALRIYHALGIRSAMLVPMVAQKRIVGVMRFFGGPSRAPFAWPDVEAATELGRRAGVAFDHARLARMSTESVRQRDDLLVAASHELRTPLTALLLHTQSIERALSDSASVDRSALAARAQKAVRQIQRLARLVDELLEASRLSAGRIWLTREQVMLSEVVDEVVERLADRAAESGTEVSVRTSGSAMGRWDRLRVEQVVENLLSNALQFAPGLPVEIRTAVADHGMATLAVRDRGPGIAPEDQERIFKRFERTTGSSGMGLGLYVTRELVRAHGGTVEVSSTPGAGAEFTVRLPSEPESATQPWSEAARDGSISRPDPRSRGS